MQSYERANLEMWFKRCQESGRPCTDPLTRQVLRHTTVSGLVPLPLLLVLRWRWLAVMDSSGHTHVQLAARSSHPHRLPVRQSTGARCCPTSRSSRWLPWPARWLVKLAHAIRCSLLPQVVPNFSLKSLVTSWAERHRISDLSTFSKVRPGVHVVWC